MGQAIRRVRASWPAALLLALVGCAAPPAPAPGCPAPALELRALGEAFASEPGFRVCCVFGYGLSAGPLPLSIGATLGPEGLSDHAYGGGLSEPTGLLYTRRGGFLDLGHVRDYADWTAWLAVRLAQLPPEGGAVELPRHGARAALRLRAGEAHADEDLIRIAERAAFELSVWHEVATWHGWSEVPIYPERVSAFDPEDLYSNLLGALVGGRALRRVLARGEEPLASFEREVARELAAAARRLQATSADGARRALDAVEGPNGWWSRERGVTEMEQVTRRNLDWDAAGRVHPWPLPTEGAGPLPLAVPATLTDGRPLAQAYALELEPDPAVAAALRRSGACEILSAGDLPQALAAIRREVRALFGPLGDSPARWEVLEAGPGRRLERGRSRDGVLYVRAYAGGRLVQQSVGSEALPPGGGLVRLGLLAQPDAAR
ncbi:MAG: DUF4056 domain-containing protein [Planctomycetota bacterium]